MTLRKSFRRTESLEERAEIGKEELAHWLQYVERRKEVVSKLPEAWIEPNSARLLKEAFDRMRDRNTGLVMAPDLVDVHGSFAQTFKFKVPIHPRNLSQMIHPHQGYMANMPKRGYTWDELMGMYEVQMVSSHEKAKGRSLHGEELSALAFWLL